MSSCRVPFDMNIAQAGAPVHRKPLRLWLGGVAVVLWLLRFVVPAVAPETMIYGALGGLVGGLAVIVWWAFFSGGPRVERWAAVVLMIVAEFATSRMVHKSIATGMMGFMFFFYSIPVLCIAFAFWAMFSGRLSTGLRRVSMVATILLACGVWLSLRTNGITGDGTSDFAWRWSKTREERLVARTGSPASAVPGALNVALPAAPVTAPGPVATPAPARIPDERPVIQQAKNEPVVIPPAPIVAPLKTETDGTWFGFRGPGRDSIVSGLRIKTDWSNSPPVQLWRRPIGPGWSSFAVSGDLLYTQEQRGDDELVTCYNAATGDPVWAHRDVARFWESNAGPGPRATPALHNGRVYTFGATGILNALNAADGAVLWSRNPASDTSTKIPGWGFSSSPLIVGNLVVVAVSGKLAAYDLGTGAPRWITRSGGASYSSPHLATIDGVPQVLLLSGMGAMGVAPADGKLLWKHEWPSDSRIMQPAMTGDGGLLMSTGDGMGGSGLRRIAITHSAAGWTTEERWTTTGLKSNFNDFVVHDGHVFGFDGGILACVDLKDGKRKWKGGRFGHGQLLLLRDQSLLLVLGEEGELGVVKATPDQFTELARFPALEGKTWNHPVLAGERLFVRNGEEMVAFRLALERP